MSRYKNSGEYELIRALILTNTHNPVELDIASVMVDAVLYESIFDTTMSGAVTISDTNNLVQRYALGSGEKVIIEWSTVGVDGESVRIEGEVYDINTGGQNSHSMGVTLHFASPEMISGMRQKAFNGYKTTTSEIVKTLFSKLGRPAPLTAKGLDVEATRNLEHIVFTGQNIWAAIQLCSNRATSLTQTTGYLFFEDNKQFNYKSIETLYSQEPVADYVYKDSPVYNKVTNATEEMFNVIQDIDQNASNKRIDDIGDGQKGSSYGYLDLMSKSMSIYTYNTNQSRVSLGKYQTTLNGDLNSSYSDKIEIKYSLEAKQSSPYAHQNKLKLLKSNAHSLNIGIHGNSMLRCGTVVNINVPVNAMYSDGEQMDIYSGKYLIADIKHILRPGSYAQRLLVIKDSFEEVVE